MIRASEGKKKKEKGKGDTKAAPVANPARCAVLLLIHQTITPRRCLPSPCRQQVDLARQGRTYPRGEKGTKKKNIKTPPYNLDL